MTYGDLITDVQAHPGLAGYVVALGATVRWLTQQELLRILGGCEPGEHIQFHASVEGDIYFVRHPDAPMPVKPQRWMADIPERITELIKISENDLRKNHHCQYGRA